MIKNYFSDITDLFLAVKKEENIQINEEAKAEIRQMLQAKIAEMTNATAHKAAQIDDSPKQPFWSTWRYQLFGVPASLFALVLIVFVTSNLKVSIPKEDFSPTREDPAKTAVVETVDPAKTESDRPLVKTAPGLLVLDFSEENNSSRSLNKTSTVIKTIRQEQPLEEQVGQEESKFEIPKIEYSDSQNLVIDGQNEPAKTPVIKTGGGIDVAAEEIIPDWQKTNDATVQTPQASEPVDSLDAEIPSNQVVTTPVTPITTTPTETLDTLEPLTTAEIIKEVIPETISPKLDYPIYTYKDETLKTQDAFTKESLAKLTKSKTPESVTVYYVEKNQVVVEIEEDGVTKWYLFDNIKGTWTISRYEKFITDNVVK